MKANLPLGLVKFVRSRGAGLGMGDNRGAFFDVERYQRWYRSFFLSWISLLRLAGFVRFILLTIVQAWEDRNHSTVGRVPYCVRSGMVG